MEKKGGKEKVERERKNEANRCREKEETEEK